MLRHMVKDTSPRPFGSEKRFQLTKRPRRGVFDHIQHAFCMKFCSFSTSKTATPRNALQAKHTRLHCPRSTSLSKVGTRTRKWEQKWETNVERHSGSKWDRMGTFWKQSDKNPKVGQEWETKLETKLGSKWETCSHFGTTKF